MTEANPETTPTPAPPARKKRQPRPPGGGWCVMLVRDTLYIVGDYRPLAVGLLKTVVPGGARRFYRSATPEFFRQFGLNVAQVNWLVDSKLFNGTWEILREYRRGVLDALGLEYSEVWVVENGQSRAYQLPAHRPESIADSYGLGAPVVMPLSWARSYVVYCHRHRAWESDPCKEAGVIVARDRPLKAPALPAQAEEETAPPTKKKWPDLELHAPANTLVRASRRQISYYLTRPGEPHRLGRDEAGEAAAREVIEAQRLALVLRAARAITALPPAS